MPGQIKSVRATAGAVSRTARQAAARSNRLHENANQLHRATHQVHLKADAAHHALASKTPHRPFLVVGVGASAGGFQAFTQLLENLPATSGIALVLVQHLDPDHHSHLTELLSRSTRLPVVQIEDGMVVEPDRIYIIPENRGLEIQGGILRLRPRLKSRGGLLTIDFFFQSLARDRGERAVGILLSGTGQDGTAGLQAIKEAGGLTFAQDEKSARHFAMPGHAQSSGNVDFVLSPQAMGPELQRLAGLLSLEYAREEGEELPAGQMELVRMFALLRAATGVDFSLYKVTTVQRRIARRMMLTKTDTLKDYFALLQRSQGEVRELFDDMLINVTSFFRDPATFEVLRKKVFPKILQRKAAGEPIRVWVPGCSTGEEVYSLAICLHEFLGRNAGGNSIQIFGTDVSESVVARARAGVYPPTVANSVSPERLRRYFHKVDGHYQIAKFIRDVCVFARQNVVEDPPFSRLDLISCRNVLIYLGPTLQRRVFPVFHYSLKRGGYLVLGTSESIGNFASLFSAADKKHRVYVRNEVSPRSPMEAFPQSSPQEHSANRTSAVARATEEAVRVDFQKLTDDLLLSQYTPPGAVVNERLEVLQFRGRTGPFLEPSPGLASLNLIKMVREELVVDLRTAFTHAVRTKAPVRRSAIRMQERERFREVALEVVPLRNPPGTEPFYRVLFHELNGAMKALSEGPGPKTSTRQLKQSQEEIRRLREEIAETRDSVQTIIEEQEATNEELKSANEEIQSSNEEMQSTNEELETAQEELQSTNEELTILNDELQNRNKDLGQVNNDLHNLISSFSMPVLMLDNDLRVRRFTPLAEKVFNLIPSDVGRKISDINPNFSVTHLDQKVSEVIETLTIQEVEVQDREKHWYSLRIRPYRTSENKIDGAVLVLVDIGEIREGLEEIVEMIPDPMLILTQDLRVSKANEAFREICPAGSPGPEGKPMAVLLEDWNVPDLARQIDDMVKDGKRLENVILECDLPNVGKRRMSLHARRLYKRRSGTCYILIRFEKLP